MANKKLEIVFFIFLLVFGANSILAVEKININTASYEELQEIIWVGPVIAQRIIDARPFYSLDELIKVSGIGEKKLEDIKKQGLAWVGPLTEIETKISPTEIIKKQIDEPIKLENTPALIEKENNLLKIDINTASLQELQEIADIGPVLGQRIIEMRPFYSLDDLIKVRGIGTKTLENIKKQGLAWVNPDSLLLKKDATEPLDKEVMAPPFFLQQNPKEQQLLRNFSTFLIAFFLSVSCGIIILILKKNLKIVP